MKFFNLIPYYYAWHYTGALHNMVLVWGNYLWFTLNYFSLKTIFLSFFRPYKRLTEENFYKEEEETKIVTIIMRLVGIVMRFAVLVVGIMALILNILAGALVFILWLLLPVILLSLVIFGVSALII